MKQRKILLGIFLTIFLFSFFTNAEMTCPFGLVDDPYPGQCSLYNDQDSNQICDYSEDITIAEESHEEYEESDNHTCSGDHDSDGGFTSTELKEKTVGEVAIMYNISSENFSQALSTELNIDVITNTKISWLHDNHALKMMKLKEIAESFVIIQEFIPEKYIISTIAYSLKEIHFGYFAAIIVFFILSFFIHNKFHKATEIGFKILSYILAPLGVLAWVIYIGYFQAQGSEVFSLGETLGYRAIRLFYIILLVKPLYMLLVNSKNKLLLAISKLSGFIMRWRREFGILVFYLAFTHGLVYFLFWLTKDSLFFDFFNIYAFSAAAISLLALLIAYITSNNYSIKLLTKNRKKVQIISYPAFILAVVHIILVNPKTGRVLGIITSIYIILKVLEIIKHMKYKTQSTSKL